MKKTITLSISKKGIAKGAGRVATVAQCAGLGGVLGSVIIGVSQITRLCVKNPILAIGLCFCEGLAIGGLTNIVWDRFYEDACEFGDTTEEIVGHLLGVDACEEKEKEVASSENCPFSVIG